MKNWRRRLATDVLHLKKDCRVCFHYLNGCAVLKFGGTAQQYSSTEDMIHESGTVMYCARTVQYVCTLRPKHGRLGRRVTMTATMHEFRRERYSTSADFSFLFVVTCGRSAPFNPAASHLSVHTVPVAGRRMKTQL